MSLVWYCHANGTATSRSGCSPARGQALIPEHCGSNREQALCCDWSSLLRHHTGYRKDCSKGSTVFPSALKENILVTPSKAEMLGYLTHRIRAYFERFWALRFAAAPRTFPDHRAVLQLGYIGLLLLFNVDFIILKSCNKVKAHKQLKIFSCMLRVVVVLKGLALQSFWFWHLWQEAIYKD